MQKTYQPSRNARICLLVVIAPGNVLLIYMGGFGIAVRDNLLLGLIFIAAGVLLAVWLVFMLTMRIDMNESSIVRSWLLGSTIISIESIVTLSWGGGRGQIILSIVYGKRKRFIMLSSFMISKEELHGIQDDILALRGLKGEPLLPRMAPYVDIEKMIARKPR